MTAPILYWIPAEGSGKVAIVSRPGGNERLQEELESLRDDGLNILVSLLTAAESLELGLRMQEQSCAGLGLEFCNFPITDRSIPENSVRFSRLVQDLAKAVSRGRRVGIHCRMGIGRSALLCVCILVAQGVCVEKAIERLLIGRGTDVPDTPEQLDWIRQFPAKLKAFGTAGLL